MSVQNGASIVLVWEETYFISGCEDTRMVVPKELLLASLPNLIRVLRVIASINKINFSYLQFKSQTSGKSEDFKEVKLQKLVDSWLSVIQ